MNKMKITAGLILFLIVLSGCIELAKNGEETILLNYSKTGSVYFEHTIKGEKGELYFNWEGDCTNKAKEIIDANISNFQKQSLDIQGAANLTEPEKTELIEENNRKINTLLSIKSTVKCKVEDDNSMGLLVYSFNLAQGFENIKLFNDNYSISLVKDEHKIQSTIKVNNTANQKNGNLLKKIMIFSEGKIESIEPKDKMTLNEGIYEIDMLGMDGKEITLTINTQEKNPVVIIPDKPDAISVLIQGFMPNKIISLEKEDSIQWIPTILLALIIVIIVSKAVKNVKLPEKTKPVPKKEELEEKILSKTKKIVTPKKDFSYMKEIKKSEPKTLKPKFNEEEKKQIKTIILSLKESFHNYSKEEIKKAVIGKGYSSKISQEVADFFYP